MYEKRLKSTKGVLSGNSIIQMVFKNWWFPCANIVLMDFSLTLGCTFEA